MFRCPTLVDCVKRIGFVNLTIVKTNIILVRKRQNNCLSLYNI